MIVPLARTATSVRGVSCCSHCRVLIGHYLEILHEIYLETRAGRNLVIEEKEFAISGRSVNARVHEFMYRGSGGPSLVMGESRSKKEALESDSWFWNFLWTNKHCEFGQRFGSI